MKPSSYLCSWYVEVACSTKSLISSYLDLSVVPCSSSSLKRKQLISGTKLSLMKKRTLHLLCMCFRCKFFHKIHGDFFFQTLWLYSCWPPESKYCFGMHTMDRNIKSQWPITTATSHQVREKITSLFCKVQTNELATETDQMKSAILGLSNQL